MTNNQNIGDISNLNQETVENLKKGGNAQKLINSLSKEDKEKLNKVLNDKKELENILKSPQALALLKMFGGGKNG